MQSLGQVKQDSVSMSHSPSPQVVGLLGPVGPVVGLGGAVGEVLQEEGEEQSVLRVVASYTELQ